MKQVIFTLFLLFSQQVATFAQTNETEYKIHVEYTEHNIAVPLKDLVYQRIIAKDNSSWGYINREGQIIIPLGKYKFLNPIDGHGMILAHKDGKEGFIDITEKVLIPFIYDDVGIFSKKGDIDLAPVIRDGKQGFINRKGEMVIPMEYDARYVTYFHEPGAAILMKNGKYGVIDPQNNVIIPFEYDKIEWSDNDDYFIVSRGNNRSSFSLDGRQLADFNDIIIISETYLGSQSPDNKNLPILITTKENQEAYDDLFSNIDYLHDTEQIRDSIEASFIRELAYVDKERKIIVPFGKYDHAEPYGLGRKAIVARKSIYGIIDEYGKPVLPIDYDFIERPSEYSRFADIFIAKKGSKVTIFDKNARVIPIEDIISYQHWSGDIFITDIHGKTGLLSYNGCQTIPFEYDTLYHSRHKGFIARKGDKYGYISRKNEIIRPFDYKYIYALSYGIAFVNTEGKVGLYDGKGNLILPFEYEAIYNATYTLEKDNPIYIVGKNGNVGTVDIHNQVVIPIVYDGLSGWVEYGPDAHFAKKDGKFGLISRKGEIIIPFEYEYVGLPAEGIIVVRKNGKYGAVSWMNEEILPCKYDRIIEDVDFWSFGDGKKESKLVGLRNDIWSYYDLTGKLIRKNVPEEEIMKYYNYIFEWGEPSNDEDFDMKEATLRMDI